MISYIHDPKLRDVYIEIMREVLLSMDRNGQKDWDKYFLGIAEAASKKSRDPSTKVGAVIVRPNKSICSTGFNGFPRKMRDDPELYADRETKYKRIIHGEMNALIFAGEDITGYTLYTWPFPPCDRCALHMAQAGIKRVVAPKPTEEQLSRWKTSFEDAQSYFDEAGVILYLVNGE